MNTKVTLREKIGYGFGDMASSMFWKIFGMYLLFFYTRVFGISPAVAGTMFLATRIWDAFNDPVMGMIADRTRSRWGSFRPYILFGAIPFALIGTLTFYTPALDTNGKVVYAYVAYILMMTVYTVVNVPYASLLGVMTHDANERTALSSYRMFFAYAGSLITFMIFQPLVDFFAERLGDSGARISETVSGSSVSISTMPEAWTCAVAVVGAVCAVVFFLCFGWTRERVTVAASQQGSVGRDLRNLVSNKPWWILLVAGIAVLVFNSIRDGVALFYFSDYVADGYKSPITGWTLGTIFLLLGQAGNMVGVVLSAPIARRLGNKGTFIAAMGLAAVLSLAFFALSSGSIAMMFVLQALISICAGMVFPLLWSMYADIVDYEETRSGTRPTGLILSSSSMSQKMGWAIGGAVTGWLLAAYGCGEAATGETATNGLKAMMSWIPALSCLLAVAALIFYPLDRKRMNAISETLNRR